MSEIAENGGFTATDETGKSLPVDLILTPEQYEKQILTTLRETVTDKALAEIKDRANRLQIMGITDKEGYKAVVSTISEYKSLAAAVEKKRKDLKAPVTKLGKAIDAEAARIDKSIRDAQAVLEGKRKAIDDAAEAERQAEELRLQEQYKARVTRITQIKHVTFNTVFFNVGMINITPEQLKGFDEAAFEDLCVNLEAESDVITKAEERRKREAEEQKRKADEEAAEAKRKADEEKAKREKAEKEAEELRQKLAALEAKQAPAPAEPAPATTAPTQPSGGRGPAFGSAPEQAPLPEQLAPFPNHGPATPAAATNYPQTEPGATAAGTPKTYTLTEAQIIRQRRLGWNKARELTLAFLANPDTHKSLKSIREFIESMDESALTNLK